MFETSFFEVTAARPNMFVIFGSKRSKTCKKCDFGISGWKSLTRPYVFEVDFRILPFLDFWLTNCVIFWGAHFWNSRFSTRKRSKVRFRDFRVKIADASPRFRRGFLYFHVFDFLHQKMYFLWRPHFGNCIFFGVQILKFNVFSRAKK